MNGKDAPHDLCLEVLRRLDRAGVLRDIVLIGSWCGYFYKDHFADFRLALRTRDIDFLIPTPPKLSAKADLPALLKDLGFIPDIRYDGYIRLVHPELIIEFLVPEKGRGSDRPYPLKSLGINAQPLRFVGLLLNETVSVQTEGMTLTLPHPILFAFQKLIISRRRRIPDKRMRDQEQAVQILDAVIAGGDTAKAASVLKGLPPRWRKAVLASLEDRARGDIITALR